MVDATHEVTGGRVMKVIAFGKGETDADGLVKREFPSKQILSDPFQGVSGYGRQLTIPPYSMEQLISLAEAHPIHSSCLEQKVTDIVAGGPMFVPKDEEEGSDLEERDDLIKWWEALTEDYTSLEVLNAMWLDYETLGWGILEVVRDVQGVVQRIYHLPAHTVRAHKSGRLFCQMRFGKQMWFKLWNEPNHFFALNGRPAPDDTEHERLANELLIFRKPSRRSEWYGIPMYVSAIGHLTLAVAARDYNVLFFENAREPRYVFVLSGLAADMDDTIDSLERELKLAHKEPHRNLLLPIEGNASVQIERLTMQQNDMHFTKLMDHTDESILTAHRMPPDRLGIARRGFLGGSVANVTNRIYKDGVVARGQDILEDRLYRFIALEYARAHGKSPKEGEQILDTLTWRVDFEAVDISDEVADSSVVVNLVKHEMLTLNEARQKLGYAPREEFEDMTLGEWVKETGGGAPAAPGAPTPPAGAGEEPEPADKSIYSFREEVLARLDDLEDLEGYAEELITSGERVNGDR